MASTDRERAARKAAVAPSRVLFDPVALMNLQPAEARREAHRAAEAAAKHYAHATADVATPKPIVVTLGRIRVTVERVPGRE